jgi:aldose 1-epimerase
MARGRQRPIAALLALLTISILCLPVAALPQARYSARTFGDVVQLRDARADVVVSVLTPVSNAYEMVVKGHNVIRMNIRSVDEMRARPGLNGIPLLAPFANRLDETAFYANGRKYNFDMELGNVRGPVPIHGYVTGSSDWRVVEARADGSGAWVTSKLDFYRNPQYMAQFPFAHTLTMTYRLAGGELEVRTRIDNLSREPMPVSIGFHPYFQLTDSIRNDWTLDVGARSHWLLSASKIPTGQTEPTDTFFEGDRHAVPMSRFATRLVDDVFGDLERDAQGRGKVTVRGVQQSLSVTLGPKYRTVVLYSTVPGAPQGGGGPAANSGANAAPQPPPPPPVSTGPAVPLSAKDTSPAPANRGFVAIEPMAGITNAMNAAAKGQYAELQSVAPGEFWQESFWLSTSGF